MEPVSRFQAWRRDRNIPDNLKTPSIISMMHYFSAMGYMNFASFFKSTS